VSGVLEVGHSPEHGCVIVNFPPLPTDERGDFHLTLEPAEALAFAKALTRHALICEGGGCAPDEE
jgi:hypothetical protein